MNYNDIIKMCNNIRADYAGMGREPRTEDMFILDAIMRIYNTTEIDHEEAKWMWVMYLEEGNLYISEAMRMARVRIDYAIRKQRIEWLDK